MKSSALAILLIIMVVTALAQDEWYLISQPGTNTIFTDEMTSYTYFNEQVGSHGSKYSILKSSDGGHNYTLIKTKTGDFGCFSIDNIFALNSETYYFAETCQGICAIIKTPDGGETWVNLGYGGAFSMSLFYLREDFGYYSFYPGYPNSSYLLQEGSPVFITPDYIFANGYPVPDQTTEIYFKNDSTGLIMCRDTIGNNVVIRSSDYGSSWSELLSFPGEAFNDMHFINDSVGFVIGSSGNIFRTASFGDSWENTLLPGEMELNSIDFNTEGTGYIAADEGMMYRSTDNGLSWTDVESPGPNEYIYVKVFEGDVVYIIDADGNLYSNKDYAGIEEPGKELIGVYPNPADAEIHIRIPENHLLIECSIYDIHGRNILNSRENKIQLNGIPHGMYLLEILTSNGVFRKKFLKR